jgi:glutathione synthase/RimK-type ligase-like ATP-grasp enzyme
MKIAIHHREAGFTERWIAYCQQNAIAYLLVDCFKNDILELFKKEKITHLMWHLNHASSKDLMVYPYVMNAADRMGIKTFPNFNTRWHFDDKVAQKYLFESMDAPLVPSYVFYEEADALRFLKSANLPLVAKLKRGAGSTNVKLIKSKQEGAEYIRKLFSEGIVSTATALGNLDQKIRIAKQIKDPVKLAKKTIGFLKKNKRERTLANAEKGYAYFQEFMPNNDFDTRIIVVGDIAFGIRRFAKENDFRASGSGKLDYDTSKIDVETIKIAFETLEKIGGQCLAFDFVFDADGKPKIVEVCFGFSMKSYDACPGYWKRDMEFVEGRFNPQEIMIRNFLEN